MTSPITGMEIDNLLVDQDLQLETLTKSEKSKTKIKSRKRTKNDAEASQFAVLTLTKPSYNLGLGSKHFRDEHRATLASLLRSLMSQHKWKEASSVLGVYLKATCKENSFEGNRFKFSALMEVLSHTGLGSEDRIKNVYDIWIRKNGSMKDLPAERRFLVHFEFIDWCLRTGNLNDAHQTVLWLIQENEFGRDPNSYIFVAKTFYQLWYSTIPKELLRTDTDEASIYSNTWDRPSVSRGRYLSYTKAANTGFESDSDSVQKDKIVIEADNISSHNKKKKNKIQQQGFYFSSAQTTGNENSMSNDAEKLPIVSPFAFEGLSPALFPIKVPQHLENGDDFYDVHMSLLNNYHKEALKYSKLALSSIPKGLSVLRLYIQLLLVGGQVDQALKELDKFCSDPNSTEQPLRIKASLLLHFDRHNSAKLCSCFEELLKKDPTCYYAIENLIKIHQKGSYNIDAMLEMIGLHLDSVQHPNGTNASVATWKEFASCFMKLSESEEDRKSICLDGTEGAPLRHSTSSTKIPKFFAKGKPREVWRLRCRSWLYNHFSVNRLSKDIVAGDLEVMACKAACASHLYGLECNYLVQVCALLEDKSEKDFLFLKTNMAKSLQLFSA